MKAAAIILMVLVLAAVGALGFLYLKAELTVRSVSCIATDTVTQPEYFDQLKEQLASSTFVGTRFSSAGCSGCVHKCCTLFSCIPISMPALPSPRV